MQNSIRIGIVGYGNLGRGVETSIQKNPDLSLVGIFTRRAPETVSPFFAGTQVFHMDDLNNLSSMKYFSFLASFGKLAYLDLSNKPL